jgi:hypothetical protein
MITPINIAINIIKNNLGTAISHEVNPLYLWSINFHSIVKPFAGR